MLPRHCRALRWHSVSEAQALRQRLMLRHVAADTLRRCLLLRAILPPCAMPLHADMPRYRRCCAAPCYVICWLRHADVTIAAHYAAAMPLLRH